MNALIKLTLCSVAAILPFSQTTQAAEHNHECDESTLRGLYEFSASGFNIVAGVAVPKAIVQLIRFNGDGTLTVPTATRSVNGVIVRSPPNGIGTYTLAPDCTGSITFGPPGPTFDVFVAPRGARLRMIQITDPTQAGPVLQGSGARISD